MSLPVMGTTSSQPAPTQTQTQDSDHQMDSTRASLPQLDGAAIEDPTKRDNDTNGARKRKSAHGERPVKRSEKERTSNGFASDSLEVKDSQDETNNAQQDAEEPVIQKPSKKKSKKDHTRRNEDEGTLGADIMATQSSIMLEEMPQSTANTTNNDGTKKVKNKRKRPTGRPSGLNLMPAGMSDPATQEDSTRAGPGVVEESPAQLTAASQVKPKPPNETRRHSGHLSPEMTNVQSSLPGLSLSQLRKTKSPKVKMAQANGTPAKSSKIAKKRVAEVQEDTEMLPTPTEATEATQVRQRKTAKPKTQLPHEPEADDLRDNYTEVDATDQIKGWLSSQLEEEDTGTVTESAKRKKAQHAEDPETTTKRRRTSPYLENDSEDFEPEEAQDVAVEDTPLVSKKERRASQKKKASAKSGTTVEETRPAEPVTPLAKASKKKKAQPQPAVDAMASNDASSHAPSRIGNSSRRPARNEERCKKGPLTDEEKSMVDSLFHETVEETGISDIDLRDLIQTWRKATEFKEAVETALPDRPLAVIRKFCQRRYHNMQRGAWTTEEDDALRNAKAVHGDKWTEISALVGRTASDCKDRWNNTVSIQDTMQIGPWSQEETVALIKAVDTCIKELKKTNKDTKGLSRAELEGMLSWAEVAKKLGGTRSAKRCNEKWQKIKRAESARRPSVAAPPLATGLDPEFSSKKLREIEKLYNQCDVGDLYDILTEIHTALQPNQHFEHESTLWAVVATRNPGSRFKSAMRRRGLHDAAGVYAAEIGRHSTIAGTAKALAEHLEAQWGVEALAQKRSFVPKAKRSKFKSTEHVESDNDEESVAGAEDASDAADTPPIPNDNDDDVNDKEVDNDNEDVGEESPNVEVPDSQPQQTARSKHSSEDFAFSFKPINKKRKERSSSQAVAEVVEDVPSPMKRKKSSKKAKV